MKYQLLRGDKKIEELQNELGQKAWPEFMQHDAIVGQHWTSLYTHFLDCQFAVCSERGVIGVGNSIPIHWTGNFDALPAGGLDWAMGKAVADHKQGLKPNLLVAVQILINSDLRSKGLSYELLDQMKGIARDNGFPHIALPVRPTKKHLYPLVSMEEYIKWTNAENEPYDPWLRVHTKSGGEIISICHESMLIEGTIDEWQEWTGLSFQCSGAYPLHNALSPVDIDLDKNSGVYTEPNVWIVYGV